MLGAGSSRRFQMLAPMVRVWMRGRMWFHLESVHLQETACLMFLLKSNLFPNVNKERGKSGSCGGCATANMFSKWHKLRCCWGLFCCSCMLEDIRLIISMTLQRISSNDLKSLENLHIFFHYTLINTNAEPPQNICGMSRERLIYQKSVNSHYFCKILRFEVG